MDKFDLLMKAVDNISNYEERQAVRQAFIDYLKEELENVKKRGY